MKFKAVALIFSLLTHGQLVFAGNAIESVRATLQELGRATHVVGNGSDFLDQFNAQVQPGGRVKLMEITGFSEAGIKPYDEMAYHNTIVSHLKRVDPKVTVLLVVGGTADGIGSIYKHISELQNQGELKNVVLSGIMSVAGSKYAKYLPEMDLLWLVDSIKDKDGQPTWEVIEKVGGPSMTVELFNLFARKFTDRVESMSYHVAEGGLIAIKEAAELAGRMGDFEFAPTKLVDLYLHTDVLPEKMDNPEKDKGYYAATSLALFLDQVKNKRGASKISSRLRIKVQPNMRAPDPTTPSNYGKVYGLEEFLLKGHDGIKISDWLNEGYLANQVEAANSKIKFYQEKMATAEDWDQTYPSQPNSNYYQSKDYFAQIVDHYNSRLIALSSYQRVVSRLRDAESNFFRSFDHARNMKNCNFQLKPPAE